MTSQETAEMKHVINGSNIQFLVDAPEQRQERDEPEHLNIENTVTKKHFYIINIVKQPPV